MFKKLRTIVLKKEEIKHSWVLVDAKDQTLGRLATKIADMLRGKDKANFTPHVDSGKYVVVVNAEKIKVTGNKLKQKMYYTHSRYAGGLREISLEKLLIKHPEQAISFAVKGMLPKNRMAAIFMRKLKVYRGESHPHGANKPELIKL